MRGALLPTLALLFSMLSIKIWTKEVMASAIAQRQSVRQSKTRGEIKGERNA
jgi:hypothetical protein